jgi:hypothetical protein
MVRREERGDGLQSNVGVKGKGKREGIFLSSFHPVLKTAQFG